MRTRIIGSPSVRRGARAEGEGAGAECGPDSRPGGTIQRGRADREGLGGAGFHHRGLGPAPDRPQRDPHADLPGAELLADGAGQLHRLAHDGGAIEAAGGDQRDHDPALGPKGGGEGVEGEGARHLLFVDILVSM